MANPLGIYEGVVWFVENEITYKRYIPPTIEIRTTKENNQYDVGDHLNLYLDRNAIGTIYLDNGYTYGEPIFLDISNLIPWVGRTRELSVDFCGNDGGIYYPASTTIIEEPSTLEENLHYLGNKLATALSERNLTSSYDEGLTTLIKRVKDLKPYSPPLDGTDNITNIDSDYELTTGNGYGGGYNQCGYLSDGFYNKNSDWELSLTLETSYWDGGFCLFLDPYGLQTCYKQSSWDCIFKNGQGDILQWIDGYIKSNTTQNYLSTTSIPYTRNATVNAKIKKEGSTFKYYEGNTLKGSYELPKLESAERVYIGVMTWGNSDSVNRFSNVSLTRVRTQQQSWEQ